ncbi:hypothetical protein TIFTF001_034016, partial [Ficus carica]
MVEYGMMKPTTTVFIFDRRGILSVDENTEPTTTVFKENRRGIMSVDDNTELYHDVYFLP